MIVVDSLAKSFGSIRAVDGISFTVRKGEILGFLGPNGAGKSTTMKMITTFLAPTAGTASIDGFDIIENPLEVRSRIGYLPESSPSYKDMKVFDFLAFAAEIRGFDGETRRSKVMEMLEMCNLKDVAWQLIDTLSKGYRQRVGFAQALLHNPDFLILDEPTDGLDPNQKQEVRSLIRRMGREKCIILSTHILEEMEAVCTRATIIGNGKIVADTTPAELRAQSELHGAVTVEIAGSDADSAIDALKTLEGVSKVSQIDDIPSSEVLGKPAEEEKTSKNRVKIRIYPKKGAHIAQETARFIHERNWSVEGFSLEKGDLNEVFYSLTKGEKH